MRTQDELEALTRDILGGDFVEFEVRGYQLTEDLRSGRASIHTQLHGASEAPPIPIHGEGVGLVDALFKGIQHALAGDYPSITHIFFEDFHVAGDFRGERHQGSRSDAPGTVRLCMENSQGRKFEFLHTSPSVSASAVSAVMKAVGHFVNAERAVLKVYDWIEDARRRSRPDLAERYVQRLAELVQNASYSDTIERKRRALG